LLSNEFSPLRCAKNEVVWGVAPKYHWGGYSSPQTPIAGLKGPALQQDGDAGKKGPAEEKWGKGGG